MLPDEALDSVFARGRESECILKHGTEKPLSNYDFVFIVSMQVVSEAANRLFEETHPEEGQETFDGRSGRSGILLR
jgi:hypothetical protein